MTTALPPDQCLTEIHFPIWEQPRVGTGFEEVSSRESDFAIVAAAAQVALAPGGECTRIAVAVGGAAPTPVRLTSADKALLGTKLSSGEVSAAVSGIAASLEPDSDVHATADYRRRVAGVLVERAILTARDEAAR
jgi:carbon-monoxide dehydrogenase medium subunit